MLSPSCPTSSVIDQSHPQSTSIHDNPLLANVAEPCSEEEEEDEEEPVDYASRLYLPVTHGKCNVQPSLSLTSLKTSPLSAQTNFYHQSQIFPFVL
ncbi:unnamed protein product [Knipowitschia caucasica]